ncbi:NAD(P)H-dependent oxidoreductase subunit E [Ferrimicrobium sp.]|uniref:NAD(P)H-dependent oxidoreductase subunit E n=1 Tax=Ferrimicrobium sp. TaxID=2926050 RepID=UPI00260A35FB|nr:NAD(P)H-dependent oxidoreductase subunit E [Ferrimicrobium sp.]
MESARNQVGFALWSSADAGEIVDAHEGEQGSLLEILVAFQQRFGYVDDEAVDLLADRLNLSRAEVYGVVTFYADLKREPASGHTIRICRGESCQAVGATEIVEVAEQVFGGKLGTTDDNGVALEQVFCLGNCALSPAVMVDGELIGRVDAARIRELAARLGGYQGG